MPSVSRLLQQPAVIQALERIPRAVIVDSLRAEIAAAREQAGAGAPPPSDSVLVNRALQRAEEASKPSLRRAINATGVILHTGLGRAVLSQAACRAIQAVAAGHSTLEIDVESGRRGSRQAHVRDLLCELTGAESALVVNNNVAAVLLGVTTLAAGREVVISRGELIEIGGSFRLPEIIRAGGARLVEVGTTNRTRLQDYREAITEHTGLLLRCHPSNFRIVGFTEETPTTELVRLGREHGIPVMDDLGSGAMIDTGLLGTGPTTTLQMAIASGCDLVTASGDKLLGGPQAGLILGRKDLIERMARHPLARAFRVDKLTLAALEATLRLYRDPEKACREIPTLRYLSRTRDELRVMARRLKGQIAAVCGERILIDLVPENSEVGGGSLPGENLPTICVRLRVTEGHLTEEELAARLRRHEPPIFARVKDNAVLLDPRTLEKEDELEIVKALSILIQSETNGRI
ncbi:MAG TPA: L-seryl-tRNA(Sec) selenium transferase [Chthonomonadales bacterium]|nr:L-seryl-tRNA(Sec) selenium transferase [Chthonomonadales bacterium]